MRKIIIFILLTLSVGLFAHANAQTYSTTSKIGKEDLHCFDGVTTSFTRRTSTGGSLSLTPINNVVDVACLYGSLGKTDAAISAAQSAVGSNAALLELSPGTWTISNNLTISANVIIRPLPGAKVTVAAGKTVTSNTEPAAGHYRWIYGAGTYAFAAGALIKPPDPAWWGGGAAGVTAANATNIVGTLTVNSATPDVSGLLPVYTTANSSPTTITAFANIVKGQTFKVIIGDANTTVTFGTNILGNSSQTWNPTSGMSMDCTSDGTYSYCINSIAQGPAGPAGPQGIQGVSTNWLGAYAAGTAYVQGDGVSYNGANYIALQDTTGNLPTNTTYWQTLQATAPALPLSFSGLVIANNSVTPNTKIDISVSSITVTSGTAYVALNSVGAGTVNCATVGADGLDDGTLAAATWYYLYVIYDGTNIKRLASASASAPTLPSGYTYKRLVGVAVTDASAHFKVFVQQGLSFKYDEYQVVTSGTTAQNWAAVSCTAFIPPISRIGCFQLKMKFTAAAGDGFDASLRRYGSASTIGHYMGTVNAYGRFSTVNDYIFTDGSQGVQLNITGATNWSLRVLGFELII